MKKQILFIIISTISFKTFSLDVPVITTNAHHHSIQHWLEEELKNKNLKGLPILHFDSHTDMGFSPSHYFHNGNYLETQKLLDNLSLEKINSFQKSLTDISQVIIPAISFKLTNEIHMCMPSWFKRFNVFNKNINFSIKLMNKAQFINAKTHRFYPFTNLEDKSLASPFFHNNKKKYLDQTMRFYRCFDNPKMTIKKDYILSLDLDILSTNGDEHDHARPISFFRSKKNKISKKELYYFHQRISKIKNIIRDLNKKGYKPRIVTIALSTGNVGGNYTPSKLALLAEKIFRDFFKNL